MMCSIVGVAYRLTSTLLTVTHAAPAVTPLVLTVFAIGMTAPNLIAPRFADRALMPSAGLMLAQGLELVFGLRDLNAPDR